MAARWWDSAPALRERALGVSPDRLGVSWYRFGYGRLELDSDDEPLSLRFRQIYPEGTTDPEGSCDGPLRVRCTVRSLEDPNVAGTEFGGPRDLGGSEV